MIEAHFGESGPWSVGAEEELMLVDAETLELRPESQMLVAAAEGAGLPGIVKTELHACIVELATGICGSALEALDALRELRRGAARLAAARGLRILASGSHPVADSYGQPTVPEQRYEEFVAYAGVSARSQLVMGLHVHVGMPNAETCYRALEGVLPWLPVVLALSANSPYMDGRETGLASARAEVLARLPRSGAPPAFGSYDGWEAFVERLARLGVAADYTRFWWDVRPHPRLGTLEVRMPDQPTSLAGTGAFIALVQALCATAADAGDHGVDPGARGIYEQNRWAALRFGPRAELVHPDGERALHVPELAEELLALVGPVTTALGSAELLGPLDSASCEGDLQLALGREQGLVAVTADLAERSLGSP